MKVLNNNQGFGKLDYISTIKGNNLVSMGDFERRFAHCSGYVKMMTGVANSAALQIMCDCIDKIADRRASTEYKQRPWHPHPRYKGRAKHLFAMTIKERDAYRSALKWPCSGEVRFFDVSDMPEDVRRKYGEISNAQYFEFWEGTGAYAYSKSRPLITSLHNKFRMSMQNHHVAEANLVAWGLVGAAVLELAVRNWEIAMDGVCEEFEGVLTVDQIKDLFRSFSLARVSRSWQRALSELVPEASNYNLDDMEERNVSLGVEQLYELWISPDLPFDSTIKAVEDYQDEIFSTSGQAKKAMRELSETRNNAIHELKENR